jgi:hypothetical protein
MRLGRHGLGGFRHDALMPLPIRLAGVLVLTALAAACRPPAQPADLVVHGGTIRTCDAQHSRPAVMVVKGGRVLALGGEELLETYRDAPRLDLGGKAVIPGLIDAHAHLMGLGARKEQVELRDATSYAEVVSRVQEAAGRAPGGAFILGRGWNQELWPDEAMPTHDALSAATPDHPVLLRRVDGHATLANARAMDLAGVTAATPDPPGGEILRDAEGRPTGVFVDAATDLLPRAPDADEATLERRALLAQRACFAAGLVGVHDAGVDERTLQVYERLMQRGALKMRINAMLSWDASGTAEPAPWLQARLARGPVTGAHGGRLSIRAVKIYADGALGSRGAALLEPYADRPDAAGLLQLDRAELVARVRTCRAAGFQAAIHAIGDAANRLALDVYEEVLGADAASDHRFRIEHAQVIALDDIPRFARLGVIASVQPTHATSDMNMAEERVGPERIRGAYAWRKLLASGARLALGSDFPVESERPLWGLFAAITRQDHQGRPEGGWHAEERLTPEEALGGFTLDAAWAGFDEPALGSLSPGKVADFVVLPDDPLSCAPSRLVDMRPVATWVGGERVFPEP